MQYKMKVRNKPRSLPKEILLRCYKKGFDRISSPMVERLPP